MLWTSTANLTQASPLLQLHTMFTSAIIIKNRRGTKKIERTDSSLYAENDRDERPFYGCLTVSFLCPSWFNLSSAKRNGDKVPFWSLHFVFFISARSFTAELKLNYQQKTLRENRHNSRTTHCWREGAEWWKLWGWPSVSGRPRLELQMHNKTLIKVG